MNNPTDPHFWSMRLGHHPRADDVPFDLDSVLDTVVSLRSFVPDDAFTAPLLGTERDGQGVVIDESGIVLTIGYLVTEAEEIWLVGNNGHAQPAHVVGYDQETGFGLVQALGPLGLPAADIGASHMVGVGDSVIVAGQGGPDDALNAQIVSVREFAGSWEYVLDEALFTIPAHPKWSGAGVFDRAGRLVGIGSLYIQQAVPGEEQIDGNMIVPIDILEPIYEDLLEFGRPNKPPRPWLGMTTAEAEGRLVVAGLTRNGPARRAGVELGDIVVGVDGQPVTGLATLFRKIWSLGNAGASVPLTLQREDRTLSVTVHSAARADFLRKPKVN